MVNLIEFHLRCKAPRSPMEYNLKSTPFERSSLPGAALSRTKLADLADGILSIAAKCENDDILGKVRIAKEGGKMADR